MNYQDEYFEKELVSPRINDIKKIIIKNEKIIIQNFIKSKNE